MSCLTILHEHDQTPTDCHFYCPSRYCCPNCLCDFCLCSPTCCSLTPLCPGPWCCPMYCHPTVCQRCFRPTIQIRRLSHCHCSGSKYHSVWCYQMNLTGYFLLMTNLLSWSIEPEHLRKPLQSAGQLLLLPFSYVNLVMRVVYSVVGLLISWPIGDRVTPAVSARPGPEIARAGCTEPCCCPVGSG